MSDQQSVTLAPPQDLFEQWMKQSGIELSLETHTYSKTVKGREGKGDAQLVKVLGNTQEYSKFMLFYRVAGDRTNNFAESIDKNIWPDDCNTFESKIKKCKEFLFSFEKSSNFAVHLMQGSSGDDAIMKGRILLKVRELYKKQYKQYGGDTKKFKTWCKAAMPYTGQSTIYNYMTIAESEDLWVYARLGQERLLRLIKTLKNIFESDDSLEEPITAEEFFDTHKIYSKIDTNKVNSIEAVGKFKNAIDVAIFNQGVVNSVKNNGDIQELLKNKENEDAFNELYYNLFVSDKFFDVDNPDSIGTNDKKVFDEVVEYCIDVFKEHGKIGGEDTFPKVDDKVKEIIERTDEKETPIKQHERRMKPINQYIENLSGNISNKKKKLNSEDKNQMILNLKNLIIKCERICNDLQSES